MNKLSTSIKYTKNSKKQILIVEDEIPLLELLADKFKDEGFEAIQSLNAEQGIKRALKHRPDLILLDIVLPGMDGISMLKKLRKDKWGKNVPVIILSNLNDQQKVSEAMKLGIYDFLVKTNVKLKDLISEVENVLE